MTRTGRTITNFKQGGLGRRLSGPGRLAAVVLAWAAAAASLIHPLLALFAVGLVLWQAFSPDR